MNPVIHIAGLVVQAGWRVRQRCAWCGAVIEDLDLSRAMTPTADAALPVAPRWKAGGLVAVDGAAKWAVEISDRDRLPDGACALIDPAVTT